jgi:hypothetical protein
MDMTMSSATPSRVEVVTSVQRRGRWTPEQKLEICQTDQRARQLSFNGCQAIWHQCWATLSMAKGLPARLADGLGLKQVAHKTGYASASTLSRAMGRVAA